VRWTLFLTVTGCAGLRPDTGRAPPDWTPPSIASADVGCDVGDARWSFAVGTERWTGNGQVLLSADGAYIERHPMFSVGAVSDGSEDALALELGVVGDFRNVVLGATTAFNCETPGLTGVLRVFTRDGDTVADCVAFGDAPERWAEWDAGLGCDEVLAL
jgi:hypothetical protein